MPRKIFKYPSVPDYGINGLIGFIDQIDPRYTKTSAKKLLLKPDGENTIEEERAILYSILRRVAVTIDHRLHHQKDVE